MKNNKEIITKPLSLGKYNEVLKTNTREPQKSLNSNLNLLRKEKYPFIVDWMITDEKSNEK